MSRYEVPRSMDTKLNPKEREKDLQRKEIQKQIDEFLKNGGEIKKIRSGESANKY